MRHPCLVRLLLSAAVSLDWLGDCPARASVLDQQTAAKKAAIACFDTTSKLREATGNDVSASESSLRRAKDIADRLGSFTSKVQEAPMDADQLDAFILIGHMVEDYAAHIEKPGDVFLCQLMPAQMLSIAYSWGREDRPKKVLEAELANLTVCHRELEASIVDGTATQKACNVSQKALNDAVRRRNKELEAEIRRMERQQSR